MFDYLCDLCQPELTRQLYEGCSALDKGLECKMFTIIALIKMHSGPLLGTLS